MLPGVTMSGSARISAPHLACGPYLFSYNAVERSEREGIVKESELLVSEIIIPGADGRTSIVADNSDEQFDLLVNLIAENLAPSSQRVYRHTYAQWRAFTSPNQLDVFDLGFENLAACLNGHDLASATRRVRPAHMLRLLD